MTISKKETYNRSKLGNNALPVVCVITNTTALELLLTLKSLASETATTLTEYSSPGKSAVILAQTTELSTSTFTILGGTIAKLFPFVVLVGSAETINREKLGTPMNIGSNQEAKIQVVPKLSIVTLTGSLGSTGNNETGSNLCVLI